MADATVGELELGAHTRAQNEASSSGLHPDPHDVLDPHVDADGDVGRPVGPPRVVADGDPDRVNT